MDESYYLIGTDGRHYGPLSTEDVRTWLADGRANRYSRARRAAEDQWHPLREMDEFEPDTRPPYLGGASSLIVVQEESEVAASPALSRLDPVSCFQRGWQLLISDFAFLTGWTLLVSIVVFAAGLVPRVSLLTAFIADQLLRGGLYALYLSRLRGEPKPVSAAVAVISTSAVTILLAAIAQFVLASLGLLLLVLPGIYLIVGYAFVLPLVVDQRLGVWEAMERSRITVHRHWWQVCALLLAQAALILLGALAAGIGLAFALPVCTAALMVAYEDLFGPR